MEPSTPVLPTQVTPPELALSDAAPHAIVGVEAVAVPVLPGDDDTGPALGPGAEELSEQLGVDLLALLEAVQRFLVVTVFQPDSITVETQQQKD